MSRNDVHSFKQRQIDGADDLFHSMKFYFVLLLDLIAMMPPCDDVISDMIEFEREVLIVITKDIDDRMRILDVIDWEKRSCITLK